METPIDPNESELIDPLLKAALEGGEKEALILVAKRVHDLKHEVVTLIGEMQVEFENLASIEHVEEALVRFGRRMRARTIVFTAIILAVIFFFIFLGLKLVDNESKKREEAACNDRNRTKAVLVSLIQQAQPIPVPPGSDPALRDTIIESNRRTQENRSRALDQLKLENC